MNNVTQKAGGAMPAQKIAQAEFIWASDSLDNLPDTELPEIAVLGRSNVGKSTLVNRLPRRRKLARPSAPPGHTRKLNFYRIELTGVANRDSGRVEFLLVDLPGFGYAKFSKRQREALSRLTVDYLATRENLCAVCLLNDCRREPQAEELSIRDLCFDSGAHLFVIATKIDKLKQRERHKQLQRVAGDYGLEKEDLLFSGEKTTPALWERLLPLL